MQKPIIYLLVFSILCTVAFIGYTQWATPTPPPATAVPPTVTKSYTPTVAVTIPVTVTVTVTATVTATVAPPPILMTDSIVLAPFTITLATPWSVLQPSAVEWANQLPKLAAKQPMLTHYLAALADTPVTQQTIALLWPPTPTTDLLLVAAVMPADGLTLQGYLAAAKDELAQSRLLLGAGVTIKRADLRYDLRQDQTPIAILHYTLPAALNAGAPDAITTGYQAIMIDKTGHEFLLLTAVTQDAEPGSMLSLIDALVTTIQEK